MQPLSLDRSHPLSARVMMFAVSGYFRDQVAGVSWGSEVQEPVMDIIAWTVLGLAAYHLVTSRSRQRSRRWARR